MRAYIVSEAVHDKRGQEGHKTAKSKKVIYCWPYRGGVFSLGNTMCGKIP